MFSVLVGSSMCSGIGDYFRFIYFMLTLKDLIIISYIITQDRRDRKLVWYREMTDHLFLCMLLL